MSFIFTKNLSNVSGYDAWYQLKTLLVSAGWVVKASGDGISAFSSSGDIISSSASGANGMGNSGAWYRIQMPLANRVNREFLVQVTTSTSVGLIRYSFSAGFVTGGSATVVPTASDQQIISSGNTMFQADNTYHINIGADNAVPYGFWMAVIINGNGSTTNAGGFLCDPIVSGSGASDDPDPYVWYFETTSAGSYTVSKLSTSLNGKAYFAKGSTFETFVNMEGSPIFSSGGNNNFPNGMGTNAITMDEEMAPILWSSIASPNVHPTFLKGASSLMRWNGTKKQFGDRMTVSSPGDRICIADVNFPWDGSVPFI